MNTNLNNLNFNILIPQIQKTIVDMYENNKDRSVTVYKLENGQHLVINFDIRSPTIIIEPGVIKN